MIDDRLSAWVGRARGERRFLAFRAYKELTLDMAAALFIGVDLGADTKRMNRVFEDLVAASMSRIRLPIPGLEFHRGLEGREFMLEFLGDLLPKKRAGDGTRHAQPPLPRGDRGGTALFATARSSTT